MSTPHSSEPEKNWKQVKVSDNQLIIRNLATQITESVSEILNLFNTAKNVFKKKMLELSYRIRQSIGDIIERWNEQFITEVTEVCEERWLKYKVTGVWENNANLNNRESNEWTSSYMILVELSIDKNKIIFWANQTITIEQDKINIIDEYFKKLNERIRIWYFKLVNLWNTDYEITYEIWFDIGKLKWINIPTNISYLTMSFESMLAWINNIITNNWSVEESFKLVVNFNPPDSNWNPEYFDVY